jgi:predicted N-acetyltransferase YhbS
VQIIVRTEQEKDYLTIKKVNNLAFEQENEGNLVEKLRKNQDYVHELSLVAEVENEVVGHILFYPIQIVAEDASFPSLALAPLAVLPDYQHKGIGKQLVKTGLIQAKQLGYPTVIVVGHPDYYPQFGFTRASDWNIRCPFDVPDASFFALALKKDALAEVHGTVAYPKAFYEV